MKEWLLTSTLPYWLMFLILGLCHWACCCNERCAVDKYADNIIETQDTKQFLT